MRLGIFGGSFDPPHVGHLLAIEDALDHLALDRVIFVPAATQPLKAGRAIATAAQRLDMVRLLVADDPRFEVSSTEIDRAGVSFTVDTLTHFSERYPTADRFFLVGADVLASFGQWRAPERILELAQLVVLERRGDAPTTFPDAVDAKALRHLATRRVDVSSTEIRARVKAGRSIRGFVTDGVATYIARAGLYR